MEEEKRWAGREEEARTLAWRSTGSAGGRKGPRAVAEGGFLLLLLWNILEAPPVWVRTRGDLGPLLLRRAGA